MPAGYCKSVASVKPRCAPQFAQVPSPTLLGYKTLCPPAFLPPANVPLPAKTLSSAKTLPSADHLPTPNDSHYTAQSPLSQPSCSSLGAQASPSATNSKSEPAINSDSDRFPLRRGFNSMTGPKTARAGLPDRRRSSLSSRLLSATDDAISTYNSVQIDKSTEAEAAVRQSFSIYQCVSTSDRPTAASGFIK